jgi:hypothetical protein
MIPILTPVLQVWVCPNCPVREAARGQTNRYHQCRGLKGLLAPMVLEGTVCRVRAVEREDYVGNEIVHYDGDGRPIMAVSVERPDGSNDLLSNVPTARGGAA